MNKYLSFIFVIFSVVMVFAGGDRVGNGGSIWICRENGIIKDAILQDRFDAGAFLLLPLITPEKFTQGRPMVIVLERELFIQKNLPLLYRQLKPYLASTLSSMIFVWGKVRPVDDAHPFVRPSDKLCPKGWKLEQFANYVKKGLLAIDAEIWNSKKVSDFDKAALIWHEAIYYWMRDEFEDVNSIRARQINMILFSTLTPAEMQENIDLILASDRE